MGFVSSKHKEMVTVQGGDSKYLDLIITEVVHVSNRHNHTIFYKKVHTEEKCKKSYQKDVASKGP